MFNMSFECFMAMIVNGIIEFLPSDYKDAKVEIREVVKNNDEHLHGLCVAKNGNNIAPNIYLESFYKEYQKGSSIEEILEHIAKVRVEHEISQFDISALTNLNNVRDKILPYLVNAARNSEYLKDKPHKFIEDLAVIYKVDCGGNEEGRFAAPVTFNLIETLGITPEELDQLAMSNLEEVAVNFKTMRDLLAEMYKEKTGRDIPEYMLPPEDPAMYVLTNVRKFNGATMILNKGVMKSILKRIGGDVIIIPSSIHEVIIVPIPEEGVNISEYAKMIQDVNASELAPNEILSDHAYLYTRRNGLMSI